jgi:hypothetical protein
VVLFAGMVGEVRPLDAVRALITVALPIGSIVSEGWKRVRFTRRFF